MESIVHFTCYHVNSIFTLFISCAINFLKNVQEPEANTLFLLGSLQIWDSRDSFYFLWDVFILDITKESKCRAIPGIVVTVNYTLCNASTNTY